jgi:hypothetical protein
MKTYQLISAANAAVNQTSVPIRLADLTTYSVQVTFSSGTLNGTLALEVSNDATNYSALAGSSQAVSSGVSHLWTVNNAGYDYVRVTWTATSGTGTLSATAFLKEFVVKGA